MGKLSSDRVRVFNNINYYLSVQGHSPDCVENKANTSDYCDCNDLDALRICRYDNGPWFKWVNGARVILNKEEIEELEITDYNFKDCL